MLFIQLAHIYCRRIQDSTIKAIVIIRGSVRAVRGRRGIREVACEKRNAHWKIIFTVCRWGSMWTRTEWIRRDACIQSIFKLRRHGCLHLTQHIGITELLALLRPFYGEKQNGMNTANECGIFNGEFIPFTDMNMKRFVSDAEWDTHVPPSMLICNQ